MKYLTYKNYLEFKRNFKKEALKHDIDLDFYFTDDDYIFIFIRCLKKGKNPSQLKYDEMNTIILDSLLEF